MWPELGDAQRECHLSCPNSPYPTEGKTEVTQQQVRGLAGF